MRRTCIFRKKAYNENQIYIEGDVMNYLITGAASGIGCAAAQYFISRGHTVYGIDVAQVPHRENFHGFSADITREESLLPVKAWLEEKGIVLDAIVNIAGVHRMVSLVESDYAAMKKVVDVNLAGTMLVNRVFHSCLKEKGRVVIVTSEVAGFDPMPFNGLYNVTKTALDTYAQALRQELNLIGQSVVTIRPGAVETPLSNRSMKDTRRLADTTVLYEKQAKNFCSLAARFMGKPIPPEKIAALIYKAATAKCPRLTYQKHRNPGLVLLNLLPKRTQCALIKFLLGLDIFSE